MPYRDSEQDHDNIPNKKLVLPDFQTNTSNLNGGTVHKKIA